MATKATEPAAKQPNEFFVVSIPEPAAPGASLRLLRIVSTFKAAEKAIEDLDSSTLGRVAIVERKALYERRPAVESVPVVDSLIK
ncbi:MAG TPA: hypothetical protein VGC03_05020 [Acidimicrobiia bacterium]